MVTLDLSVLTKAVLTEYAWVLGLIVLYVVLLVLVLLATSKMHGNDGLGVAVIYVYVRLVLFTVAGLYICVIRPALVLVRNQDEIAKLGTDGRIGVTALILFPAVLYAGYVIIAFLGNRIDSWFFHRKYETGRDSYTVDPEQYKCAADFREKLMARGLCETEDSEALRERLNSPYPIPPHCSRYFYGKPTFFAIDNGRFTDNTDRNCCVSGDSTDGHPLFVYNAVLTFSDGEGPLRYVPAARYVEHGRPHGFKGDIPVLNDYYIECKILFVDGELYALIGPGESRPVNDSFPKDRPYYAILSEKDDITTWYDGRYCPHGAIENQCAGHFEMHPNTNVFDTHPVYPPARYPVRKVDRVDADAINRFAAELQEGILRESIEEWRKKKEERELLPTTGGEAEQ